MPNTFIYMFLLLAFAIGFLLPPGSILRPSYALVVDSGGRFRVRKHLPMPRWLANIHLSLGSVLASIFSPVGAEIEAFGKTVESDIVTWLKAEDVIIVDYAKLAWQQLQPILTQLPASQLNILIGLIQTAAKDAAAGDYAGIYTAVLAQATTAETAFIANLSSQFVQAWAAIVAYQPPANPLPSPAPAAA